MRQILLLVGPIMVLGLSSIAGAECSFSVNGKDYSVDYKRSHSAAAFAGLPEGLMDMKCEESRRSNTVVCSNDQVTDRFGFNSQRQGPRYHLTMSTEVIGGRYRTAVSMSVDNRDGRADQTLFTRAACELKRLR